MGLGSTIFDMALRKNIPVSVECFEPELELLRFDNEGHPAFRFVRGASSGQADCPFL